MEILTTDEASIFLKISSYAVRDLVRKGVIPGKKVGRDWRFIKTELLQWLQTMPMSKEMGDNLMPKIDNKDAAIGLAEEYLKLAIEALKLAQVNKDISGDLMHRQVVMSGERDELKKLKNR